MAQQAVFTVLVRGSSIVVDEAKYLWGVSNKVESAKKQLMRMQGFLKDLDDKMLRGGSMARNLVTEVREVAYEVENIIDIASILMRQSHDLKTSIKRVVFKYICFPIYLIHLHKLRGRIESANTRMKTIFEDFEKLNIVATAIAEEPQGYITEDNAIQHWRLVHPDFGKQTNVIGFDDQIEQIKDDLLDGRNKYLTVVSIIGPGGAGKSTMAGKVYSLAAVKRSFEVYAWITVSQRFVPLDLFKEMVKIVVPHHLLKDMIKCTLQVNSVDKVIELEDMTEQEVKKLLHDFALSKSRYLIVLDDMWSTEAWDIIRAASPDNKNGSRVVLTTRNEVVAQHPDARKKIYRPKLLNEDESTQLLLATALPEYILDRSCSPDVVRQNLDELKELGKDLAVRCQGLPLAIIVLGGYLSRNLDVAEWKRLTSSVNWHDMISNEKVIGAVMDLSYYDMPSHLRLCFMYTTSFPEDLHIDVQVLARLWIAEGFIPPVRGHSLEEVTMKYIAELVQRCLIQMEDRASSGRITVIKVHDILRDWGIGRARKEGLIKDCHSLQDVETAYSNEMEAYRMVLHGFEPRKFDTSMRQVRTLLDFTLASTMQFQNLHNLRVLYLHGNLEVYLPWEIGGMRYLRHLGFGGGCLYHLPPSIGELPSLETMHATAKIEQIPGSLWKIPTLKHVHAYNTRGWSMPEIGLQPKVQAMVFGNTGDLLSSYSVIKRIQDARRIVEATKLQISKNKNSNLSCCFGMTYNMLSGENQMDIVGRCKEGLQCSNDLPDIKEWHSIFILKVYCANLFSNDQMMWEIGRMCNLKELELGERSYTGSVMTFLSNSFPILQRLVLHDLAVERWKTEYGSMKNLQCLTLSKLPNLICLPDGLLMLQFLIKLDLNAMPPGCHQQGSIVKALKEKGCMVSESSSAR